MEASAHALMLDYCSAKLPEEACGMLAISEGGGFIDTVIPIRNASPSPKDSFSFDPDEWTSAFFSMQKSRQSIAGFFHSHPTSEGSPSYRDIKGFLPSPDLSYWIISLNPTGRLAANPYRLMDGYVEKMLLVLA